MLGRSVWDRTDVCRSVRQQDEPPYDFAPAPGGAGRAQGPEPTLDLAGLAPVGYYLALRVGFVFPMEEVNELPDAWIDHYTRCGFMLSDPVIRWIYSDRGFSRWSQIPLDDPREVLRAAREHGLFFGAAVSVLDEGPGGQRSFGTFARSDREFTEGEMELLHSFVYARHEALCPPRNLTAAELEALRLIKEGQRLKQIAYLLGVTEGAVKQRLKNARIKLEAKTGAEAISRASSFGLI